MRGSQKNFLQQIRVNIRFIFPRINNRITYPACLQRIKQSQCLYYFSTRSIHNKRFPLQTGKEIRIRQMERFIFPIPVQRSMKGYYITFPCQYRQIHKSRFPPVRTWRIIQQDPHPQCLRHTLDTASHMSYPNNPQTAFFQSHPLPAFQQ